MKNLILLMGLPRSGKSTLKNLIRIKHKQYVAVSADDLRYIVYGQRYYQQGESLVWSIRGIILNMLMLSGQDVIIDECNTTVKRRKYIIDEAKKYNYNIIGIHVDTEFNMCLQRSDDYIYETTCRMNKEFEKPTINEGFDCLTTIRNNDYSIILTEFDKMEK